MFGTCSRPRLTGRVFAMYKVLSFAQCTSKNVERTPHAGEFQEQSKITT